MASTVPQDTAVMALMVPQVRAAMLPPVWQVMTVRQAAASMVPMALAGRAVTPLQQEVTVMFAVSGLRMAEPVFTAS